MNALGSEAARNEGLWFDSRPAWVDTVQHLFVDSKHGMLEPLATIIVITAASPFIYVRTVGPSTCGSVTCCLAHVDAVYRVICVIGWFVSVGIEVMARASYASQRSIVPWVIVLPQPFFALSILTAVPEAVNGDWTSHMFEACASGVCEAHMWSTYLWCGLEFSAIFVRRPGPGCLGYLMVLVVGVTLFSVNVLRFVVGDASQDSHTNKMFGALELIGLLLLRSVAADSTQKLTAHETWAWHRPRYVWPHDKGGGSKNAERQALLQEYA